MADSSSIDVGSIAFDTTDSSNAYVTTSTTAPLHVRIQDNQEDWTEKMDARMEALEMKLTKLLDILDAPSNPDAPAEEQVRVGDVLKEEIKRLTGKEPEEEKEEDKVPFAGTATAQAIQQRLAQQQAALQPSQAQTAFTSSQPTAFFGSTASVPSSESASTGALEKLKKLFAK